MQLILYTLLAAQIIHFACTWKLYKAAGFAPWRAIVPVYSTYIETRIIQRPWWWVILFFVPVVGNIMAAIMWVDMARAFGRRSFLDGLLVVVTLGLYLGYLNYSGKFKYDDHYQHHRAELDGGWFGALIFAIVAATLIRTFAFEAYTIPTSSMEGTLLVGDYLFVNKINYGSRIPMTPVTFPLIHDTIPFIKTKSYLEQFELPYMRLPKITDVKRNDIVVFNWPTDNPEKPIDKKMNYVKRAVAIPGDTLQIKDGEVFINGQPQQWTHRDAPRHIYQITAATDGQPILNTLRSLGITEISDALIEIVHTRTRESKRVMFSDYDQNPLSYPNYVSSREIMVLAHLSSEDLARVKAQGLVADLDTQPADKPEYNIFPSGKPWNADNYGPLIIPKAGDIVSLTPDNVMVYRAIIEDYEGNRLETRDGKYFIDGAESEAYIIRQNYYFMMGDNRNNSWDSRYWGFVPQTHIVGKPVFIWMSIDPYKRFPSKIRWERVFTTVQGEGQRRSYLIPFFVTLGVFYIGYKIWRKKKDAKKDSKK